MLDLLATRNFHPEMLDRSGRPTDAAEDAKTLTFDYVSSAGKNYGTMVIILDIDNDMKVMYGDNLGRTMEGDDKQEFFDFVQQLNQKATKNRWTHTVSDISQLKHVMQGIAAIQEGLFEGYYGNRKISWTGNPTEARLRIVHNRVLDENDARHRYIDRMFIETAEGECFRLGFKSLAGGKAMLEHVRQGGKPYDVRGCHITEMVNEIAVLGRFNRASSQRILEGVTEQLVTEAQAYYQSLRENLKSMSHSRGYQRYFETWHPATITEQDDVISNIKTLFIEQTIDSRIEAALPLLAKIQQQGESMKEVEIFENWADRLVEGTWSLPETPEQMDKLKSLMTKELIVGPDATNATEQLYDLVGDDILFDRLSELAARDPRANAWNDTEVMSRLRELGIETPEQAPAGVKEPAAPAAATAPGAVTPPVAPVPPQGVTEGSDNIRSMIQQYEDMVELVYDLPPGRKKNIAIDKRDALEAQIEAMPGGSEALRQWAKSYNDAMDEGVTEGLKDVVQKVGAAAKKVGGKVLDTLGHPDDEELLKDLQRRAGVPQHAQHGKANMAKSNNSVDEGQCNMTAEGKYCPRHGLAECAMEEEAQPFGPAATAAIQQGKPPTEVHYADTGDKMNVAFQNTLMKEFDDPMDSRHAVTDSFYENEIDRIKKLALSK